MMQKSVQNKDRHSTNKDLVGEGSLGKKGLSLKESEELFRSLVELTSDWIWQVNEKGVYTYVSPKVKDLLGFEPAEVLRKTPFDLMPKDEAKRMAKIFQEYTIKKIPFIKIENWNYHKNGNLVLLETSGVPVIKANGQLIGYRGIDRDITERKKMEEELKDNEQLYRTLFDNSEDGFILIEPIFHSKNCHFTDFIFVKMNPAYEQLTGSKSSDVLGKRAKEVVPKLEPSIISTSNSVLKTQKIKHTELFDIYSNKWYDSTYFPFGKNRVGILFRDITESKKSKEALQKSEAILKSIIDNSSDQIFMLDRNHRYLAVNKALADVLGISPKEVVGKLISEIYPPETAIRFTANIENMFKTEKSLFVEENMVVLGKELAISTILNPVKDSSGNLIAVTGIVRDITQRKNLDKQLKETNRLAAIGQTAGMVGHDIRNPLQAIAGDLYLIDNDVATLEDNETKKSLQESVISIQDNLLYIAKIVEDLQDYAKVQKPTFEKVEIEKVIEAVMQLVNIPPNLKVVIDTQQRLPKITADFSMMKRILSNLVNNAVQAMPTGGQLKIKAHYEGAQIFFSVEDTGSGIPDEVKPKLFEPMFTTKAKGQGLGLAVVKRFVEALNGSITFESTEGKGTKFIVQLPSN
jgi:PAS domain S-box-containing protein